jgi:hypothetical protein
MITMRLSNFVMQNYVMVHCLHQVLATSVAMASVFASGDRKRRTLQLRGKRGNNNYTYQTELRVDTAGETL